MTPEIHHSNVQRDVAVDSVNEAHALVPTATVAVVVEIDSQWRPLAQRGPIDVSSVWRADLAELVRDSDYASYDRGYFVAPFSAIDLHALLVIVAENDAAIPNDVHHLVKPLLDTGGVAFDQAFAAAAEDREAWLCHA
jgi:hypothetical protein